MLMSVVYLATLYVTSIVIRRWLEMHTNVDKWWKGK
jgi:hypothetical protein